MILAICCMSLLVVGMDVTIVNVALPAIQRDLHSGLSGLQWILDAYTLVVANDGPSTATGVLKRTLKGSVQLS